MMEKVTAEEMESLPVTGVGEVTEEILPPAAGARTEEFSVGAKVTHGTQNSGITSLGRGRGTQVIYDPHSHFLKA